MYLTTLAYSRHLVSMGKTLLHLVYRRKTLLRVLADEQLRQLGLNSTSGLRSTSPCNVLIAGGGRSKAGSEKALLANLELTRVISLDIDDLRQPDIVADLEQTWPLGEGTFDLIISTWVMEHLRQPQSFIAEAHRCLAPQGRLVLTVPLMYHKHAVPHDFLRFTDHYLDWICRKCGFTEVSIYPLGSGPFLACVSLLWPVFRLPTVGILAAGMALMLDRCLRFVVGIIGKGATLIQSYHIGYVVVANK